MLRFTKIKTLDETLIKQTANDNNISLMLAAALLNRGIAAKNDVQAFLYPTLDLLHDPFFLPDMNEAVKRITLAINNKEKICVYGDYDADGICAAAMLLQYLNENGAKAQPFLPSRQEEGYGLHKSAIKKLNEDDISLLITVDNGITAKEEVAYATSLGIDVIVTDHHQCVDDIPVCIAVLNPNRKDSGYPFKKLCGAGVVLKLIQALGVKSIEKYLPLCALATVADVVELKDENRIIVSQGIELIRNNLGLNMLLEVSGCGQIDSASSEVLAFRIAPRINAAGRMGDAKRALRLLITTDNIEAKALALELNDENSKRQSIEHEILNQARRMAQMQDAARQSAIMLFYEGWHPGIIGIVASKLKEEFYRPVFLFSLCDGVLTGSCRSISKIHLLDSIIPFKKYFKRFGGHSQAAGITMDLSMFEAFKDEYTNYLWETYPFETFIPEATYEEQVRLDELSFDSVRDFQMLAPFGEGNREPVLFSSNVKLLEAYQMGKEKNHLKAVFSQNKTKINAVSFGKGELKDYLFEDSFYDIAYTLHVNEWMGTNSLQLQMTAIEQSELLKHSWIIEALENKFHDAFFYNFIYNETQAQCYMHDAEIEKTILDVLINKSMGSLILCFTYEGALRLTNLLRECDNVQTFVHSIPHDVQAYNTVLFSPVLTKLQIGRFDNVYIYDGYGKRFNINIKEARVVQSERKPLIWIGTMDNISLWNTVYPDRDKMAELFRFFISATKDQPSYWKDLVIGCPDTKYETALLALMVFIELKFFNFDKGDESVSPAENPKSNDLGNSIIYSMAVENY